MSLCGVAFHSWSHFLVNYLPKLEFYSEILKGKLVTIFVPEIKDKNISEIINYYIKNKFSKNTSLVYLKRDQYISCNTLHYIENFSKISDHSLHCYNFSIKIPNIVRNILPRIFDEISNNYSLNKHNHEKIYIRRGSNKRCLENSKVIETYFEGEGYQVIDCKNLSIEEKINIFCNVKYIVCDASSALSNILFCKQNKLKILGFSNYSRCFDSFFCNLLDRNNIDLELIFIPGNELEKANINSNYYIKPEKIYKAAKLHGFV